MLRSLRHADETPDVRVYLTSRDGKILKSLAVTLRDEHGRHSACSGSTLDISELVQAQRALAALTSREPARRRGRRRARRSSPATSARWWPA